LNGYVRSSPPCCAARLAEQAPEPFDKEVTLCDQLAAYLAKFVVAQEAAAPLEQRDLSDALEGFKPMAVRRLPCAALPRGLRLPPRHVLLEPVPGWLATLHCVSANFVLCRVSGASDGVSGKCLLTCSSPHLLPAEEGD
jgi:hypothetical protein